MNLKILLIIGLLACILSIASLFLPWWSSVEYLPDDVTPYVTQNLHILPAQYLIQSGRLVVYREIPLNGSITIVAWFLTLLLLVATYLGISGIMITHSHQKKRTGRIMMSVSGILCLTSTLIFYTALPDALWPWFSGISESRGNHFLPHQLDTAWGLTFGFFSTLIAGIIFIIVGGILTLFPQYEDI